jgi:hypothetical protein
MNRALPFCSPVLARRQRLAGNGSPLSAASSAVENFPFFQASFPADRNGSRFTQICARRPGATLRPLRFVPTRSAQASFHPDLSKSVPRDVCFTVAAFQPARRDAFFAPICPNQPCATLARSRFAPIRGSQPSFCAGWFKVLPETAETVKIPSNLPKTPVFRSNSQLLTPNS